MDENAVTRSVRKLFRSLGYVVHTPPELFGSRAASEGARDEEWLSRIRRDWVVLHRDLKIYEREEELAAYRRSGAQVYLLPGNAKAAELLHLVEINLDRMCSGATLRQQGTWRLTEAGLVPYDDQAAAQRRHRRKRKG
jgi:hypothetical protein